MKKNLVSFCLGAAAMAAVAGTISLAQPGSDKKPATPPEMQLPPGWTEADMKACMDAGTPGANHEFLTQGAGKWYGKTKMWMAPGTPAMETEMTSTMTSMLDGRFMKCEVEGAMPGMPGPFNGLGIYGFDNVAKKFQAVWVDNCGTTMMIGTGELAADKKTQTWNYSYTCPITKKPTTMREVHKYTSADAQTMEMYGIDPKSGKEFKKMEMQMTRKK